MTCIFDENLPPKLAKALNELEGERGIEVKHLREIFPPSTADIEWRKELSQIEDCFVITKDRNIKKNPHEFKAWQESKLPIIFMQKSWKNQQFWDLSWKLIKQWKDIKQIRMNKSYYLPVTGKMTEI